MNDLDPPAIVKPAADFPAMLAEFTVIYSAYSHAEKANVQRAIELGKLLGQIRDAAPHGQWLATLERLGIAHQRASEFMRLAKVPETGSLEAVSITQAIASVSEKPPETIFCRPCRIGTSKPKCKACKELRKAKAAPPPPASPIAALETELKTEPEPAPAVDPDEVIPAADPTGLPARIKPYFADTTLFEKATKKAKALAKMFVAIEQTPAYKVAVEGKKHREHSSYIKTAGRFVNAIKPVVPCPNGCGVAAPSADSDPCDLCGGKGFQCTQDIEVV